MHQPPAAGAPGAWPPAGAPGEPGQPAPQYAGQTPPPAPPMPGEGQDAPPPGGEAAKTARDLADGEWHRLHPLTPIFRGGAAGLVGFLIIFWFVRDWFWNVLFGVNAGPGSDPVEWIWEEGLLWVILLIALGILLLSIFGVWISWRFTSFRVTDQVVETRSGVIARRNRRAPLTRVQAVEVHKPLVPRLFGLAKLQVEQGTSDGNVDLAYLSADVATALRREILVRASGRKRQAQSGSPQQSAPSQQGVIGQQADRLADEFLRPDFDAVQPAQMIYRQNPARLFGGTFMQMLPWFFFVAVTAVILFLAIAPELGVLALLPALLPLGLAVFAAFASMLGNLRLHVSQTQDGIRIMKGLGSVTSQTLPPGRIFSLSVNQPLLWRPFGWMQVSFGRMNQVGEQAAEQGAGNTLVSVGTAEDVFRVLTLVVSPELAHRAIEEGVRSGGDSDEPFVVSPPRARVLRWWSRRRNGVHANPEGFILRKGRLSRTAVIVPAARVQSISISTGFVYRMLRLAKVDFHTVGTFSAKTIGALDASDALEVFHHANYTVREAIRDEGTDQWGRRTNVRQPLPAEQFPKQPVSQGERVSPSAPPPQWPGSPAYPAPSQPPQPQQPRQWAPPAGPAEGGSSVGAPTRPPAPPAA